MAIDIAALEQPWIPTDTFASRLRQVRHELNLKVEEMAERIGRPMPTYASWERGTRPHGLDDVVNQIAERTGVDRNWLMWGSGAGSDQQRPSRSSFEVETERADAATHRVDELADAA